ncbi:MAG: acyl-CoA synthetase [Burkholderiaceae bacterium]
MTRNRAIANQNVADLLRRTAKRMPRKDAIRCGSVQWSYSEFDALSSRLACGIAAQGVAFGDRVAILARNSHAFAALRFALPQLGAVLVPVNYMLNAHEIAYILRHAGARMLCVDDEFLEVGRAAIAQDTAVEMIVHLPSEAGPTSHADELSFEKLAEYPKNTGMRAADAADLAQIIYTSGTESLPKGAMLTHSAVIWQYVSCIVDGEIDRDDVMLHAMPLFHCAQLDVFLGPAVYVGSTNIITSRPVAERVLPLLAEHHASSFFAPPSIWIGLLRSPLFEQSDLSALQKGYYGASIMPVEVLLELQRRLPRVRLWNFYGQTEIAPLATVLRPEDQLRKAGSAGRAALNVETRVVRDDGSEVEIGEIGEIVHRSPQLLSGYFHDEERTLAAFEGDWFHSGDLATIDAEGYITVVDRKKDMIKTGGENVASREVEEAIYRLEKVSEVAVVGIRHPHWIEAVTAVIVVKSGRDLNEQELIEHCREHLAHFKIPKRVVFTDSLPKNPSGKLLKRELRERYQNLFTPPQEP